MDWEKVAKNLKRARVSRGASMQDCADAIGVQTVSAYYKKETGMVNFSLQESVKLAKFHDMTMDELFREADD